MMFLPQIEFASEADVEREQLTRLRALLDYVSERSPFYKQAFANADISPSDLVAISDLSKFPFTTKDDIYAQNWDFLCVPRREIVEYTSTSGTSGKPVTIALTASDLQRLAYNEAISFTCADCTKEDVFQLMLTLDRQFMAGIAYYEGIRELGAGVIRVGPGLPQAQWETINRLKPTTIVAVPSFILKLLNFAEANSIDYKRTSVKKIICIGESIRDVDLRLNALGRAISERWSVQLFGTYASTEMQTAFTECVGGAGGHLHPELVYVELVDERGLAVPEGEPGEVVVTTLGIQGMPLIRYKTGDIARAHKGKCICGRTTMRLGGIEGRKQQMIKFKGTTLYPPSFFNVLNMFDTVADYVVEVFSNEYKMDEVRVHVLPRSEGDAANLISHLYDRFQSVLRVVPDIRPASRDTLEQLIATGKSHKLSRFVDSR